MNEKCKNPQGYTIQRTDVTVMTVLDLCRVLTDAIKDGDLKPDRPVTLSSDASRSSRESNRYGKATVPRRPSRCGISRRRRPGMAGDVRLRAFRVPAVYWVPFRIEKGIVRPKATSEVAVAHPALACLGDAGGGFGSVAWVQAPSAGSPRRRECGVGTQPIARISRVSVSGTALRFMSLIGNEVQ